jgi:hypothetical protein
MGCNSSHASHGFDLIQEYQKHNLPMPDPKIYQNDFEKEAYMAINLIRQDPKGMSLHIKDFKKHKFYKG